MLRKWANRTGEIERHDIFIRRRLFTATWIAEICTAVLPEWNAEAGDMNISCPYEASAAAFGWKGADFLSVIFGAGGGILSSLVLHKLPPSTKMFDFKW
jgi:hypothetical protein